MVSHWLTGEDEVVPSAQPHDALVSGRVWVADAVTFIQHNAEPVDAPKDVGRWRVLGAAQRGFRVDLVAAECRASASGQAIPVVARLARVCRRSGG